MGAGQAPSASATEAQGGQSGRAFTAGPIPWCAGSLAWARNTISRQRPRSSRSLDFRTSASAARQAPVRGALARMVGERLGWKVYDEELIEAIAHRMEVPIDDVRALDEQAPSMVQDWLLPLREEYYAPQEAYLDHLAKLIEAIGRAGESILVGRGAGFMLPRETTLSLRVIAPLKVRAQRLAERMGVSVRTARRAAQRPRSPPGPVRSHHASGQSRTTRTISTWCSTRPAWAWRLPPRSLSALSRSDARVHCQRASRFGTVRSTPRSSL